MAIRFLNSIHELAANQWNKIAGSDYPFTRYEFLAALEDSGSVGESSGWRPHHLVMEDQGQLQALMPCYIKNHSYGEYVFDWAWADAYERNGYSYYPKLVAAIPFTPASGPRLCIGSKFTEDTIYPLVTKALQEEVIRINGSSAHILFPEKLASQYFSAYFMLRAGVQYHWINDNYQDFSDFLISFTSRKRKNLRKERKAVFNQNIEFKIYNGNNLTEELCEYFYLFYQLTYVKRSGHGGYLSKTFFQQIARTMPEQIVLVLAYQHDMPVAGALNFCSSDTLFGRYWGCRKELEFLHFETCYYQGIEHCIRSGLKRFDPGAQGEHKIQRGFRPVQTWSNHWIANSDFKQAIKEFLGRENHHIEQYLIDAAVLLPFKNS